METLTLEKSRTTVLTDILEILKSNVLHYESDEDKEFSIAILNLNIDSIKQKLKDKSLSNQKQLQLINSLQEFNRILDALTYSEPAIISQAPENLEEYPPYHLYKKSQSAFGKVKK